MQWDDIRAFVQLAETKTLTHTAKSLDVSVATITRKIDRLEADLGFPLVRRSPTGIELTPEGTRILALAKQGGAFLGQIDRVATAISSGELRDPIRISSTEPVIADMLAPHAIELYREHPNIQLDLMVSAEISNLHRQEADLAIRLARPKEPSLMARKLAEVEFGVFVARSLMESSSPDPSWRDFRYLSFDQSFGAIPEVRWIESRGLRSNVCFLSSSTRAHLTAVQSGLGAAILPIYMAIRDPELVQLDAPAIQNRQLWLVFHRDMKNQVVLTQVREWIKRACVDVLKRT